MRLLILLPIFATAIIMSTGCKSGGRTVAAPMEASASSASSTSSTSSPTPRATPPASSISVDATSGELGLSREITFEVRPLNGPGTMGPRVLSASSEGVLEEVRAWLAAHPDAGRLRIECAANPMTMSGMPTPRWPAGLALQVARWLVEHGVDCKRLDVVGWLDRDLPNAGERVRFFVGREAARDPKSEARLDPCSARD